MILYHFTGLEYLDAIMEDGLSKGDVPTSATEGKTGVWFTTDQDSAGHGLGVEMDLPNGRRVANKRAVRITVSIPSSDRKLVPWMKWARKHCNPDMFAGLNRSGGGKCKSWYIYFGAVKPDQFSNIEFLTSTPPRMVFAQLPDGRRLLVYGSGVAKAIMVTGRSLETTQESVAILSEDEAIPVDAVKSIDELTCKVSPSERSDPRALGLRIKERIADNVGPFIACSIGFAANRQLAKMACKAGKPNGNMVWHPNDMPGPLLHLTLRDVPGIGERMEQNLARAGITTMAMLLATQPKHMRKLWGNVTGERLWYALHGYDVQTPPSGRGMYGHGRVLPPDHRTVEHAKAASRLLLVKAARRMRRDGWNAGRVWLWLELMGENSIHRGAWLPAVHDDQAVLTALEQLWNDVRLKLPRRARIMRVGVTLLELSRANERQLDILLNDDNARRRWESTTAAIDKLNRKHGRTLVSIGPWTPPPGSYAGGKISYTRIPRAEDFW